MGGNELQTISAGIDLSNITDVFGLLLGCGAAYAAFVLKTIKNNIDAEKNARLEDRELFRDYKRDVALIIQELIECKNDCNSRLDKIEKDIEYIFEDLKKHHRK